MKQHISDEPLCLMPRCFVLVGGGARKPHEHARPPLGIIGTQQAGDDGESLATADGEGNLEYLSTLKIWNLTTGEDRLIAQFLGATTHIAFSPDGSRLAAASNLNFIGSITRNPVDKKEINRIQTGGNIHVWKVSDGSELLKVDIELPEYSAKMMQLRRDEANNDFDSNLKKAAVDAMVDAYQEEVLKRAPIHLTFSSDGQRLISVSGSGQETIIDSSSGKPIRQ